MVSSVTSIDGSSDNETINGNAGDDVIFTSYTNPTIYAGDGNDTVAASVNSDTASSIYIEGGNGNDQLSVAQVQVTTTVMVPMPGFDPTDPRDPVVAFFLPTIPMPVPAETPSNATIIGGAGEDTIALKAFNYGTLTIEAGDDNDTVLMSGVTVAADVDLGAGDDTVTLTGATASSITSGTGSDTIVLDSWGLTPSQTPVVTDFTAGVGGDVLDFSQIFIYLQEDYGLSVDGNAYEDGFITAEQDGEDVVFYLDPDASGTGYSASKLITLQNVTLTDLVTANFADGLGNYSVENTAPEAGTLIEDIEVSEDSAINVTLGKGIFTDADSDALKLKLTLANGDAAPAWLSYSAATHAIVGNPPANYTGTISLKLTASDAAASASQTFDLTVTNVNDIPTGGVSINGTAVEDGTLTAVTTALKDADGLGTLSYSWLRDGVAISGATAASYTLGDADVGSSIKVMVSYTDGNGTREAVSSTATAAVSNVNDAPTGAVTITGTAKQTSVLTADISAVKDADGMPKSPTLQWFRDGVAISGGTGTTYTLVAADVGKAMSVTLNYADAHGQVESVKSAATELVASANLAPEGDVSITGTTSVGSVLSADVSDLSDGNGLGDLSYVWLRNGAAIDDATSSSYTLTASDAGAKIAVQVSYTDGIGTQETVTSLSATVTTPVIIVEPVKPPTVPPVEPISVTLTTGNDTLRGGSANDTIIAGLGSDSIAGGLGSDLVRGGAGSDQLLGNRGNDVLFGGNGADTVLGGHGSDSIYGGFGHDSVIAGSGNDQVRGGSGNDYVVGGAGSDTVIGGIGSDTIYSGRHTDILYGGRGDDIIFGNKGNDTLNGGVGDDTIVGGAGDDLLTGGEGADLFIFSRLGCGEDTLMDFTAEDTLLFSGSWTTAGYASVDAFMDRYVSEVDGGVLIELERGNSVFLADVDSVSELEGRLHLTLNGSDYI